jgi:predicted alpha/beta-hydrolase family hydrolase
MCHYVTLIAPTDDVAAVRRVMNRHGRAAELIENPSVAKVLRDGERQFLTTPGHCDCGTVLAGRREGADLEKSLAAEEAKLARRGWSAAKIERALGDRRRAAVRPAGGGGDSAELWANIIQDLRSELRLPGVGLLVHLYSGVVTDEVFDVSQMDAPVGRALVEIVAPLAADTVTRFADS